MKKILLTILCSATTFGAFAQELPAPAAPAAEDGNANGVLIIVAISVAILAMVAHMICEHFRGNLNTEYTVDEFRTARKAIGAGDMTAEEVADYNSRIDKVLAKWNSIAGDDGKPIPYPFRRLATMKMLRLIKKITTANPTDKQLVERVNDINDTLNHALRRQFSGSKAMVVIAILVAIISGLIADSFIPPVCIGTGALLYLLASRSATFLIAAKQAEGKEPSNLISGLISSLFIGAAAPKTDKPQSWTTVILAILVMIAAASFLALISVVNYIRNYVIYR